MWNRLRESEWFGQVIQLWIISAVLLAVVAIDHVNGDRVWPTRDVAIAIAFIIAANIVVPLLAIWGGGGRVQ